MQPVPANEADLDTAIVLNEDLQLPAQHEPAVEVPAVEVPPGLVKWCRRLGMASGAVESWGTIQVMFLCDYGFIWAVVRIPEYLPVPIRVGVILVWRALACTVYMKTNQ